MLSVLRDTQDHVSVSRPMPNQVPIRTHVCTPWLAATRSALLKCFFSQKPAPLTHAGPIISKFFSFLFLDGLFKTEEVVEGGVKGEDAKRNHRQQKIHRQECDDYKN